VPGDPDVRLDNPMLDDREPSAALVWRAYLGDRYALAARSDVARDRAAWLSRQMQTGGQADGSRG
jgi:hypothetical protein